MLYWVGRTGLHTGGGRRSARAVPPHRVCHPAFYDRVPPLLVEPHPTQVQNQDKS